MITFRGHARDENYIFYFKKKLNKFVSFFKNFNLYNKIFKINVSHQISRTPRQIFVITLMEKVKFSIHIDDACLEWGKLIRHTIFYMHSMTVTTTSKRACER
jgi:hypothetical protein